MKQPRLSSDLRAKILISLGLLLFTALAYWGVARSAFISFDDPVYVLNNYSVQNGLSAQGMRWAFTTGHGGNWHPMTWLSHMLDVQLFGLKSGPHHLVNLLFHLANTVLLFLLFRKITGALWRSAFVAALFALHPLHVESVAWVAERKDVLSTFFGLLTIWFYARSVGSNQNAKGKTWNLAGALFFYALGLMSKPMLVTLPCLLLLLDFWPLCRFRLAPISKETLPNPDAGLTPTLDAPLCFRLIAEKLLFLALAVASSLVTFFTQKSSGAIASLQQVSFSDRAANAVVAYVAYLGKIFWPHDLAILYPVQTWPLWQALGAALLLFIISMAAVKLAARRPYVFTGWFWFVGMLVPVIGLIHIGSQAMADRYTYLSMVGILVVVAWGAFDLLRSPRWRWTAGSAAVVIIGVCFVITRTQVAYWKDGETLYKHALSCTEKNVVLQSNLASDLIDEGRVDEAIVLLSQAVSLNPEAADAWSNYGAALERQGKVQEAAECYAKSLALNPKHAGAQNNYGYFLLTHGQLKDATPHFQLALRYEPEFPQAYLNLGNVLYLQGHPADALGYYEKAIFYRSNYADAHANLARACLALGQLDNALRHAQRALELKPDFEQARDTLGTVYLQRGQLADAESCFRKLSEMHPENALYIDSLGLVMIAQKNVSSAAEAFAKAVSIDAKRAIFPFHLGNALLALHQTVPARQAYRKAITVRPDYAEAHYQLGMILMSEGKLDDAEQELAAAIKSKPEWREALNNLAWLLATGPDAALRNGEEALRLATKARQLARKDDFDTLDTLAAAYAEAGQFSNAVVTAQTAWQLATNSSPQASLPIQARVQLYRSQRAYRDEPNRNK